MPNSATFLELQTRVLQHVKVSVTDVDALAFVKNLINQMLYDVAREDKQPERRIHLPIPDTSFFVVDDLTTAALPSDFLIEERVTFAAAASAHSWDLAEGTSSVIHPAPVFLKPRAYQILKYGGSLDPFDPGIKCNIALVPNPVSLETGDRLYVDYYSAPAALVADADYSPSAMWDDEIVNRAVARYWIRDNRLEQAAATLGARPQTQTQSK